MPFMASVTGAKNSSMDARIDYNSRSDSCSRAARSSSIVIGVFYMLVFMLARRSTRDVSSAFLSMGTATLLTW